MNLTEFNNTASNKMHGAYQDLVSEILSSQVSSMNHPISTSASGHYSSYGLPALAPSHYLLREKINKIKRDNSPFYVEI